MTPQQIIKALESAYWILEVIEQDPGWSAIARDEEADPEIATDMGDALHYVGEMISKLGPGEMQRQQKISRKYRIFNGRSLKRIR